MCSRHDGGEGCLRDEALEEQGSHHVHPQHQIKLEI
jgi:hypothetical protein